MGAPKQITTEEIVEAVIPLFAESGFNGVTMRQIAAVFGVKASSLYYHFPDKETLYLAALKKTFDHWPETLMVALNSSDQPMEQLRKVIFSLCELMAQDRVFSVLIHREILDGDESRLKQLAETVFANVFDEINTLCHHLSPDHDPHLMTISIFALVSYHFQLTPIRRFLPGYKNCHDGVETIAEHAISMLEIGFSSR